MVSKLRPMSLSIETTNENAGVPSAVLRINRGAERPGFRFWPQDDTVSWGGAGSQSSRGHSEISSADSSVGRGLVPRGTPRAQASLGAAAPEPDRTVTVPAGGRAAEEDAARMLVPKEPNASSCQSSTGHSGQGRGALSALKLRPHPTGDGSVGTCVCCAPRCLSDFDVTDTLYR